MLIDVINDFGFPRGDELYQKARPISTRIAKLKQHARGAGIPAVCVNDNFGRWQSRFDQIVTHCSCDDVSCRPFAQQLLPHPDDYFALKPKHSGFFQTPLEVLLKHLGAECLILTGVSTNSCVLFTANDAYIRDLDLVVPQDCVAAPNAREHEFALDQMETMFKANIALSTELDMNALCEVLNHA